MSKKTYGVPLTPRIEEKNGLFSVFTEEYAWGEKVKGGVLRFVTTSREDAEIQAEAFRTKGVTPSLS